MLFTVELFSLSLVMTLCSSTFAHSSEEGYERYHGSPPKEVYHGPPPKEVYHGPPPKEVYHGPPPKEEYHGPSPKEVYHGPPPKEEYHGPSPKEVYHGPPPKEHLIHDRRCADGHHMNDPSFNCHDAIFIASNGHFQPCNLHSHCYPSREPTDWCTLAPHYRWTNQGCHCDRKLGTCVIERFDHRNRQLQWTYCNPKKAFYCATHLETYHEDARATSATHLEAYHGHEDAHATISGHGK